MTVVSGHKALKLTIHLASCASTATSATRTCTTGMSVYLAAFRAMASPPSRAVSVFRRAYRTKRIAEIIPHVDRGKTTLEDGVLKQPRVFRDDQVVGRVMKIVDTPLLVDVAEGPMPQPWFGIHLPALVAQCPCRRAIGSRPPRPSRTH